MKQEIEKLLLPFPKVRKGTKALPSKEHQDKRKKKEKHKKGVEQSENN